MTPEKQAALIAEWLDKPPGTPPPEGVDPDAIEAIYALKPEMAPAPKVSIDDILAGVGSGPFFENKVAELPLAQDRPAPPPVEEQPEEPQQAQVIDLAARRRRRIWGGVGVAAMAALVLFSIAPEQGFENLADAPMPEEQAATTTADPAPSTDEPADFVQRQLDSALEGEQDQLARSAKPQAPTPKASSASKSAPAQEWDAPPPPPEAEPEPATIQQAKEEVPSSGRYDELTLSAGSGASSSYGAAPTEELEEEEAQLYDEGIATQSVSESVSRMANDYAPKKRSERRRVRGDAEPSAAPAVADMEYADDLDEAEVTEEPIPSDLDGLRAAAVPADYSSSWYLRALGDAELDRFDKALETGDEAALIGDSNVLIGQDMAFRAAKRAMGEGQSSQALSYVRQGQKRSSANTPFLANLYYLEGRLLERAGDTEAAREAYRTAANLNRAR